MLELVRLSGVTRVHHLKRKDQAGHVEYWKAQCGESRMLRLGGGKERKLLPIRTNVLTTRVRERRLSVSITLASPFGNEVTRQLPIS